jgi:NADH-quinone oxidoreductase subunit E
MLSEDERREIEDELPRYPQKRAASVEALKLVQKHRGWVSDEDLEDVAALLEMSPEELDGVATFYNLIYRRPVGRHVILLCDSVSCWITGSDALCRRICERLSLRPGETDRDGRFTVLPMACLGTCDHAPAIMVDEDLHRDLTPDDVDRILSRYP